MNLQDHCEDCCTTAALYVLGALAREEAQQFEKRLAAGCPLCSAAASEYAGTVEALAMSVTPRQPSPELRERLLKRVLRESREAAVAEAGMTLVRQDASPWVPFSIPGVETRPLLGNRTVLVRMQPRTVYPEHEHPLAEQCYVLEGSVTDANGLTVYAGDYICMPAGSTHSPIRSDTGCLLLIAYG